MTSNIIIEQERAKYMVKINCPRLINSVNIPVLLTELMTGTCRADTTNSNYLVVFKLNNDEPSLISRAILEDQILNTVITRTNKYTQKKTIVDSFWTACKKHPSLLVEINESDDPNEAKWKFASKYKYCVVNNFMPGYVKALYEYLIDKIIDKNAVIYDPKYTPVNILDQSMGWGDRLLGAMSCLEKYPNVRYTGFDPNKSLRYGYADIMKLFNKDILEITDTFMEFTDHHRVHSVPVEQGLLEYPDNHFDIAFTSPPYFDFEIYSHNNPVYKDWIMEFYVPLIKQTCRVLKPGRYMLLHIDDSMAGNISNLLMNVRTFCELTLVGKIGLLGLMSNKTRSVWMFQKNTDSNNVKLEMYETNTY